MPYINKFYKLAQRPQGLVKESDFSKGEEPVAELLADEVLIKNNFISLDPTNRIWMVDVEQYMPPVQLGDVMRGIALGTVIESRHSDFQPGDIVTGLMGWQTHPTMKGRDLQKAPALAGMSPTLLLGPLGMTGVTAYFGLLDIGRPKQGETIVVSGGAGAVGSVVCQLAKNKGLRVVGIAGSDEKCQLMTETFKVDGAINYKSTGEGLKDRLKELCPDGIDIYFENVGGSMLDAVLPQMNIGGRIPLCGLISSYNAERPVPGPYQFAQIPMKRLTVQGFIVIDYQDRAQEATNELAKMMANGQLIHKETVVEGFDRLPQSLNMLFSGANTGKLLVKL